LDLHLSMQVIFLSAPVLMVPIAKFRPPQNPLSPPSLPPCSAIVKALSFLPLNMFWQPFAAWASTMPPSKSMDRKCRSWTARQGPFVAAIDQAGIVEQGARRRFLQVLKPVQVAIGDSFGEIRPHAAGFRAEVEINFANPVIGRQSYVLDLNPETFRRDIARARTFGCMNDVARLWSAGFALGASFENSVVFDDDKLLNAEGLRYTDECARHKVLDAVGDLALAGLPILGAYKSVRGGHKLNNAVLCALMADRSAWKIVEADAAPVSARRGRATADVTSGMLGGMIAPAFGPDVS
jgi:UDP-3-O-[3-hydroxymyristoyl] N-acetylglucosamine deacetylase